MCIRDRLWLAHLLLRQTPDVLQAAIILALWVGLSGGLHLSLIHI